MARKTGFFRWFRTLPLLAVALTGALCLGVALAPGAVLRRFLFPVSHREAILESAGRHGVDPRLVCAVIACESSWDADAYSEAGAVGLMQVMPETAETLLSLGYVDGWSYSADDLSDPVTNIEFGTACLDFLEDNLETTDQVIAAYNAGIGTVQTWIGEGTPDVADVIAYPETRLYLVRVTEYHKAYQALYDEGLSAR